MPDFTGSDIRRSVFERRMATARQVIAGLQQA
jgi:hypothetical protein